MASAAATATLQQSIRRGDLEEDDGGDLDSHLPPRVVIGPDENGVRKVIEHRFDNEGNKVKVMPIISPVRKLTRVPHSRSAIERRSWPKSGDAVKEDAGSRLIAAPTEGSNAEEPLAGSIKGEAVLMACRTCYKKGDHWTSKCPYRALQAKSFVGKPPTANGPSAPGGAVKRAYPPPVIKKAADRIGDDVKRIMYDDRTVCVTNLSEDTSGPGLIKLFGLFGYVTRVYIPVDEKTASGRGVGFVKFAQRRQAEAAIRRLSGGYTYDNCKLQVGWAAQRVN
ncbi:uncharacterized protein LOC133905550 isoform X2 [Phragmites australis]|uniref:uncharacterized protein LOC133905550 isoform X2 n=1 Tax=Phragmites australis TaxID=29695 RepID=UPI002D794195|nr:uncharacterized protein LOC133905550 isoform X2 [Phragmites australis]